MEKYRKFQLRINGVLSYATDDAQRLHTAEVQVTNTLAIIGRRYIKASELIYDKDNKPVKIHNIIIDEKAA